MPAEITLKADLRIARPGGSFTLDVTFEAPPGVTILFGPSGSGKSTALAAIAGLLRPASGRITLGDETWFDSEKNVDRPVHRRGLAFVFQSLALFPHKTALGNVVYGMDRALSRAERRDHAIQVLTRLKVGHLADRRPATFSGGEAQRVAVARAFAMRPRIVLLDEPFSAMDRQLRHELTVDVRGFVDELNVPLIHVTHHRAEARALGDRVVLLRNGRVVATGSGTELLSERPPLHDQSFDDTPMPKSGRS
jgi:molybdate transport system ATP-binding protein